MTVLDEIRSQAAVAAGATTLNGSSRTRRGRPRWERAYLAAVVGSDAVAMAIGSVGAEATRFGGSFHVAVGALNSAGLAAVGVAGWVGTMALGGAYNMRSIGSSPDEYRRVVNSAVRFLALVAIVAFVSHHQPGRAYVALAFSFGLLLTLAGRHFLRRWLYCERQHGRFTKSVLVVGSEQTSHDLVSYLTRSAVHLTVVGACVPGGNATLNLATGTLPILGEPHQVRQAAEAVGVDIIAVADTATLTTGAIRRLAWELEGSPIELMAVPALTDVAGPRISVQQVGGLPLLYIGQPEFAGRRRFLKEAFDRAFAAMSLGILLPVLVVIALMVRIRSHGPALFHQERIGIGGRRFKMWKFRTMTTNAESQLSEIIDLNETDGLMFKIRGDPRITPVGRLLRSWSLDELPQLWNVLCGHMSIVGPRPPLPSEVNKYGVDVRRRLLVKPGMTGLWQVSGRADLSWDDAVRLDLHYVENWSLALDALVMARTVKAVVQRRGAC